MNEQYTLVIGNKNDSSFEEHRIALYTDDSSAQSAAYECGSTVPILVDGEIRIWDSLAILEVLAEKHKDRNGWPDNASARALARSISAEMHPGFITFVGSYR